MTAPAECYRPGNGVTNPVPIYQPEPQYSEEARKAKWQGAVLVSLVVDADRHAHGHSGGSSAGFRFGREGHRSGIAVEIQTGYTKDGVAVPGSWRRSKSRSGCCERCRREAFLLLLALLSGSAYAADAQLTFEVASVRVVDPNVPLPPGALAGIQMLPGGTVRRRKGDAVFALLLQQAPIT